MSSFLVTITTHSFVCLVICGIWLNTNKNKEKLKQTGDCEYPLIFVMAYFRIQAEKSGRPQQQQIPQKSSFLLSLSFKIVRVPSFLRLTFVNLSNFLLSLAMAHWPPWLRSHSKPRRNAQLLDTGQRLDFSV